MKTILVIDDDHGFRSALGELLSTGGWDVIEAEDGESGLRLARERRPSVVLCDLLMPRCNGFQVCRAIKHSPEYGRATRIVVTSGSSYATDRVNALEAGADEYLTKPVRPDALFALLEKLLGNTDHFTLKPDEVGAADKAMKLRFWGVRGSIPTPGPNTVFYGGNTSCVEVRAEGEIVILDAGTGIRPLGQALAAEFKDRPIRMSLLISHTHWDHIQGFPFFQPAYDSRNELRVLSYEGAEKSLQHTLSSQMESAYFPISMQQMPGHIVTEELKEMEFKVGRVEVRAIFVNHPGVCVGYRLNSPQGSIAYVPDNELFQRFHGATTINQPNAHEAMAFARRQDEKLAAFLRDVDVAILDAQYDAQEYQRHIGWGHSCVDDAVEIAMEAGVKRLFLFHHDPNHNDDKIAQMVAGARQLAAAHGSSLKIEAAREGLEVVIEQMPSSLRSSAASVGI